MNDGNFHHPRGQAVNDEINAIDSSHSPALLLAGLAPWSLLVLSGTEQFSME
jgi:hypothetical protein